MAGRHGARELERVEPAKLPGEVDEGIWVHSDVGLVLATPGPRSHFFGYYDKTPFDEEERRLLCHSVAFDGRMVASGDRAEIGLWDLDNSSYTALSETAAFNWQQGSLLQWLPGSHGSRVVFNDRLPGRFAGVCIDVEKGTRTLLPATVYALTPDGRWSVSPRFERLYHTPGYHYEGLALDEWRGGLPPGDALLRMDLHTGGVGPIVEVAHLAAHRPTPSMAGACHYVDHVWVAPTGLEMIFVHRWKADDEQPFTRLYRCNLDGTDLRLYPDSGRYSHATWLDPDRFLIWGRPLAAYARLRHSGGAGGWLLRPLLALWRRHSKRSAWRKLAHQVSGDGFLIFGNDPKAAQALAPMVLTQDGHPSACPVSGDWLLLDTYPDQEDYQHLLLYHVPGEQLVELARVYVPPSFQDTGFRCDLHPRWSPSGRLVCIDALCRAQRQMMVLDVSALIDRAGHGTQSRMPAGGRQPAGN